MTPPETLAGRLLHHARTDPGRCAVAGPRGRLSYAELAERVEARSAALAREGVGGTSASVVGVACSDDLEHLVVTLAVAHLGATSCALPSHAARAEREAALEQAGATFVVADGGAPERLARMPGAGTDPLLTASPGAKLLFSTSGTTGAPKWVCHADAALVAQAPRHVGAGERFACLAAMEHNFVRRHRLYCVAEGATNVLLGAAREDLVAACRALELTTLHVSAFQAQELLGVPRARELRGVRLKLGGSHVTASLRASLRASVTETLQCGYGTTETGAIAFTDPGDEGAGESVGRPLEGLEVHVAGTEESAAGAPGELAIRCTGLFLGYLGQPDRTAERLVDGWFHTGDVGALDEGGRLHLAGRSDDVFVFNSMNIHPQDLEAQILEHPAIVDAVVLPQPSPVHGDVPVALVVRGGVEPLDLRELKAFVRARAGLRCPRRFAVVDAIPRNDAGKVRRDEARALLRAEPRR